MLHVQRRGFDRASWCFCLSSANCAAMLSQHFLKFSLLVNRDKADEKWAQKRSGPSLINWQPGVYI